MIKLGGKPAPFFIRRTIQILNHLFVIQTVYIIVVVWQCTLCTCVQTITKPEFSTITNSTFMAEQMLKLNWMIENENIIHFLSIKMAELELHIMSNESKHCQLCHAKCINFLVAKYLSAFICIVFILTHSAVA